jgi:ribosomal protein L5
MWRFLESVISWGQSQDSWRQLFHGDKRQIIFEINYDKIEDSLGMNIHKVTSAKTTKKPGTAREHGNTVQKVEDFALRRKRARYQ